EAVAQSVAALVDLLCDDAPFDDPEPVATGRIARLAARTLARELVRCWRASDAPPPGGEMLRCLERLHRVEGPPGWVATERDSNERPTPLDLVVEFAHDLRSPLTSILFLSETLRKSVPRELDPVQHRQVGIIYTAALTLVSLASNVIDLARGDERLIDRRPTQFSIREVLDSVCEIVAPMLEEKKVSIRTVAPPVDIRMGYPVALSRVLLNLLSNALRFTDEGYIEITAQPVDATCVEFVVRDTGSGFDLMHTEEGPANDDGAAQVRFGFAGSGLGLTICRRLLRAMDSELQFETAPGWGTRFHFRLNLPPSELP
ncbi:MAG TPA: HAMP domain-containing sensor histidine kinase, partial [Longimicrobiaceae bacterium]